MYLTCEILLFPLSKFKFNESIPIKSIKIKNRSRSLRDPRIFWARLGEVNSEIWQNVAEFVEIFWKYARVAI